MESKLKYYLSFMLKYAIEVLESGVQRNMNRQKPKLVKSKEPFTREEKLLQKNSYYVVKLLFSKSKMY